MSGRLRVSIGAPVRPADDQGRTERPVSVRVHGQDYSARCTFHVVNGCAVYSIGECDDAAFAAINHALRAYGDKRIARILGDELLWAT